ncbi:MAG TPA: transcription antitermination factor NusB [Candidatus Aminicenantes bacterium]|nr:transcription antitermination factor NusB [Candidatus Aminicenantes bacterium]
MKRLRLFVRLLETYRHAPAANFKLLLGKYLDTVAAEDRPFLTHAAYGLLRKRRQVGHVITRFARRLPVSPADPIYPLLEATVFLLLFADGVPAHAVGNAAVGLAGRGRSGFVNALARHVARSRETLRDELEHSPDPALRFSISPFLVERLGQVSPDPAGDLAALDREPVFHLHFDPRRLTLATAREKLERDGIEVRTIPPLGCLEIHEAGRVLADPELRSVFFFQNSGSHFISRVAAEAARQHVFDGCAAPGTKTIALALLRPDLSIVAGDGSPARGRLLSQSLRNWSVPRVSPLTADLLAPPLRPTWPDLVIIDAPCSASGTLRKNPDRKEGIDAIVASRHAGLQGRMLDAVDRAFPAASILYSVCSFLPDEGEEVTRPFARRSQRSPQDLAAIAKRDGFPAVPLATGTLLRPGPWQNDLFYLALLSPKAARDGT